MAAFTLDTSGFYWSDLSPFAQGYVEALFASVPPVGGIAETLARFAGFSDLAPEALAAILRDCEAVRAFEVPSLGIERGAKFWSERQGGLYHTWPPLTPYLNDEGRVCLREAS